MNIIKTKAALRAASDFLALQELGQPAHDYEKANYALARRQITDRLEAAMSDLDNDAPIFKADILNGDGSLPVLARFYLAGAAILSLVLAGAVIGLLSHLSVEKVSLYAAFGVMATLIVMGVGLMRVLK